MFGRSLVAVVRSLMSAECQLNFKKIYDIYSVAITTSSMLPFYIATLVRSVKLSLAVLRDHINLV